MSEDVWLVALTALVLIGVVGVLWLYEYCERVAHQQRAADLQRRLNENLRQRVKEMCHD